MEDFIKFYDFYSIKPFPELLQIIKENLEKSLHLNSNYEEKNKKSFEDEIKSRKRIDLVKIYNNFQIKK